jgi:hypothetical protein
MESSCRCFHQPCTLSNSSKKIYKTHKDDIENFAQEKEFEIAQVVEGETLPSSPS